MLRLHVSGRVAGGSQTADTQIRQQSMPPHMNPSTFSVAWDIVRTGGLRGLYRGYTATLIRESAYGPYFCS